MAEARALRRVAYVTARFPPMRTSGTYRVEAVMDFLPAHGWEIEPVTLPTDWMDFQAREGFPGGEVHAHQPESQTDTLVRAISSTKYVNWIQRALFVPDLLALWARSAASQMARELTDIDVVYGTSPPYSGLVAAQRLADQLGVPCVQEVRDPPSFHRSLRRRSDFYRERMVRFERKYLTAADQVITVTPRTRLRLLELHPGLDPDRVHVVTNGYPEIEVDTGLSGRDPSRFTVTYVGTFQGSVKARESSVFTPAVLMDGMAALPAGEASLRIVGSASEQQIRNVAKLDQNGVVEFLGLIDREAAIAEVATADVAVILADDDDWWIGRKAFEYLRHAHTILAVVPPGDTTDLLASHTRVDVVSPDDLSAVAPALERRFAEWKSGDWERGPVPEGIQTDRTCVDGIARVLAVAVDSNG